MQADKQYEFSERAGKKDRSSIVALDPYYDNLDEFEIGKVVKDEELQPSTDALNEMGGSLDTFDASSAAG